jgi:hypothetical protein
MLARRPAKTLPANASISPVRHSRAPHIRHSREGGNPLVRPSRSKWIPAFAGMTI